MSLSVLIRGECCLDDVTYRSIIVVHLKISPRRMYHNWLRIGRYVVPTAFFISNYPQTASKINLWNQKQDELRTTMADPAEQAQTQAQSAVVEVC